MPKKTFLNLQPAKQRVIVYSALLEFTDKGYSLGNIGTVATYAGVAKGSFYQYFEDKLDFYLYLTDYTYSLLLAVMQRKVTSLLSQDLTIDLFIDGLGAEIWSIVENYPAELCFICSSRREQEQAIQKLVSRLQDKFNDAVIAPIISQKFQDEDPHAILLYCKAFVLLFLNEMSKSMTVLEEQRRFVFQRTKQEWLENFEGLKKIILSGI